VPDAVDEVEDVADPLDVEPDVVSVELARELDEDLDDDLEALLVLRALAVVVEIPELVAEGLMLTV
jgi:hypothetical protein